jgi:hypothetical protein
MVSSHLGPGAASHQLQAGNPDFRCPTDTVLEMPRSRGCYDMQDQDQFRFRRAAFYSSVKGKVR